MRLAVLLLALGATAAHAGVVPCKDRVIIDSVYQNSKGGGQFEYKVLLHNAERQLVSFDLVMDNFDATVSLFSPKLAGVKLNGNESDSLRIGNGTSNNIGATQIMYDKSGNKGRAFVSVQNCKI